MWQAFKAWLSLHSISSKSVAAGWLFIVGMYYGSTPFHDYVTNAYTHVPKGLHEFIAGVVIPACLFWKTWKTAKQTTTVTTTTTVAPDLPAAALTKGDK